MTLTVFGDEHSITYKRKFWPKHGEKSFSTATRHITQQQAGVELGISPRWVRALLKRVKREGDGAVVHGLRGRPSNRKLPAEMKSRALMLFRQQQRAKQ
jgi:hypothetical protein